MNGTSWGIAEGGDPAIFVIHPQQCTARKIGNCATFFERFTSSCDMASPYFDFHLGAGVSHNAKKSARKLMDPFFLPHLKRFLR